MIWYRYSTNEKKKYTNKQSVITLWSSNIVLRRPCCTAPVIDQMQTIFMQGTTAEEEEDEKHSVCTSSFHAKISYPPITIISKQNQIENQWIEKTKYENFWEKKILSSKTQRKKKQPQIRIFLFCYVFTKNMKIQKCVHLLIQQSLPILPRK